MKSAVMRLGLSVMMGSLITLGILLLWQSPASRVAAYGPSGVGQAAPLTTFHLWDINEIFSCPDGSVQFIELFTTFDGQNLLNGQQLRATNLDSTLTNTFIFTSDSGTPTANKTLLIATAGFENLSGGVAPDFTIPPNFLFTAGGAISLVGADTLNYGAGALPLDGVNSLGPGGATQTNSPRNFAGQTGSIICPLTIKKESSSANVQSGEKITYTLTVTGSGATTNTNTVLTDTLPLNTLFITATGGVTPSNNVLTWTLGDLPAPLTVVSRTFVVTVSATAGVSVVNEAYGARSDQASVSGRPVVVQVAAGESFIYLPTIFKEFGLVDEHAADLTDF